jgi:xylan 1,4-beta-xylosidase
VPSSTVPAPDLPSHPFAEVPEREGFEGSTLPQEFQWLRSPWPEELFSLTERPGHLRLYGRETIGSSFRQALIARRQQSHCYSAVTKIDFEPDCFQQMAGLVCYYNSLKYHYLYLSHDESLGRHIRVMSCVPDQVQPDVFGAPIPIPNRIPVDLRVEVDRERLLFAFRVEGWDWQWLPGPLDASILSDEAGLPGNPNFTGAFVGMCCQDLAGSRCAADFDYFYYKDRDYLPDPRSIAIL